MPAKSDPRHSSPPLAQHGIGHAEPGFLSWVGELVHLHRARLLGYARRRGLDAEDALDVVQDTFIGFLGVPQARAIAHTPDDSIKLLTIMLRHAVLNRKRKGARRARAQASLVLELTPSDALTNEELVAQAEELARVSGCIMKMAQLQRDVVRLSLVDQQPHDEIAAVLGISNANVRVLLHRAREHIRNCPVEDAVQPRAERD